jgi:hypothetical protein
MSEKRCDQIICRPLRSLIRLKEVDLYSLEKLRSLYDVAYAYYKL